jgi:hypothetical protein
MAATNDCLAIIQDLANDNASLFNRGELYIPPAVVFINSEFCPQTVIMSCMILRINSDYFLKQ